MAVFIAVRQDKRKQSNNLWYGRTYNPNSNLHYPDYQQLRESSVKQQSDTEKSQCRSYAICVCKY